MSQPAAPRKSPFGADLAPRAASGAVLIALALAVTYWGGPVFAMFWLVAFGAILWEWLRMLAGGRGWARVPTTLGWAALALAAVFSWFGLWSVAAMAVAGAAALIALLAPGRGGERALAGAGALYAGLPMIAVIALRGGSPEGAAAMFWLYAVVWATDIGAYFVGRSVGGPKLWPSISPGKTWSGAAGGTVLGALAGLALAGSTNDIYVLGALGFGASLASQAGDLFESALKRRFGVKDSSALIPGHGGVMDRLDGFAAAAVLAAIVAGVNSEGGNLGAGLFLW